MPMIDDQFQLTNAEPKPAPVRIDVPEYRQKPLFSGLDCLAGQESLFATDGVDRPSDER
jgi:hypothetical protein